MRSGLGRSEADHGWLHVVVWYGGRPQGEIPRPSGWPSGAAVPVVVVTDWSRVSLQLSEEHGSLPRSVIQVYKLVN